MAELTLEGKFTADEEAKIFQGILEDNLEKIEKCLLKKLDKDYDADVDVLLALLPSRQRTIVRGI